MGVNKIIDEVKKRALENISKDDSILQEIDKRLKFQQDGIEFRDFNVTRTFERLPEILRPQITGLTDPEFQVYQDYDTMIETILEDEDEHDPIPRFAEEESKLISLQEN